jgi:hypothetical protein
MRDKDSIILENLYDIVSEHNENILNEMMSTKRKLKWEINKYGEYVAYFNAPNETKSRYMIEIAKKQLKYGSDSYNEKYYELLNVIKKTIKKNSSSYKNIVQGIEDQNFWEIQFLNTSESDVLGITGTGSAAVVLSIITNGIVDFLNTKGSNLKYLFFNADEDSRKSLYTKIVSMISKRLSYKIISADIQTGSSAYGGKSRYWIFYK